MRYRDIFQEDDEPLDDLTWEEALDDAKTPQDVAAAIAASGAHKIAFDAQADPIYVIDRRIIVWDGKDQYASIVSRDDWINDLDPSNYYPDFDERWNADFWDRPSALYHATTPDNLSEIEQRGIEPRSTTRGISNRSIGAAVFTTSEVEETEEGSYGEIVFEIDTRAMARDGLRPYVAQEPNVIDTELRSALAHSIGYEEYEPYYEGDMSPNTVIVYGAVPPQYLTRV